MKNENMKTWRFMCYINRKWYDVTWANFVDIILFTLIGSVVGALITQPTNFQQSLAAGLGWMGLISSNSSQNGSGPLDGSRRKMDTDGVIDNERTQNVEVPEL